MITLNCGAIPEQLLEAEFFGVAPGAYTGAERKGRDGKLKLADGGYLYDGKVLKAAAEDVVKSRTIPTWPTIAEALEACEKASSRLMRSTPVSGGRGADHWRRCAEHTMGIIRAMDDATTPQALKRLHDDWLTHAQQNRVAPQIRQHMMDKYRGLLALFEIPDGPPDRKSAASGGDR